MTYYWPAFVRLIVAVGTLLVLPFLSDIRSRQDLPFSAVGVLSLYPLVYGAYAFYLTFFQKLIPPFRFNFVESYKGIGRDGRTIETYGTSPMYFLNWALPNALRMLLGMLWPVLEIFLQLGFLLSVFLLKAKTGELRPERAGSWSVSGRGLLVMALVVSVGVLLWGRSKGASFPRNVRNAQTAGVTAERGQSADVTTSVAEPVPTNLHTTSSKLPSPAGEPVTAAPSNSQPTPTGPTALEWSGKLQLLRKSPRLGALERSTEWADVTLRIPQASDAFEGELSFPTIGVVAHLKGTRTASEVSFVMDSLLSGPPTLVSIPSSFSGRIDGNGVLRGTWNIGTNRDKGKNAPAFWLRPEISGSSSSHSKN